MDILRRFTDSTTYVDFYPKTKGQNVFDSNGSVALLNGSNKINTSFLPDYILGNLIYGGTFVPSTGVATLTDDAKAELGVTTSTVTFTSSNYATYQGFYFVTSAAGTFATITFAVGDWIVANNVGWVKIDNTDAMISVNGKTGIVGVTLGVSGNTITLTSTGNEDSTSAAITVPYATKALQDGSGNKIVDTYLPKAGGTISNNLTVSGTITEGTTLLSNKYFNAVASSGTGNAITSLTDDGGTLTYNMGTFTVASDLNSYLPLSAGSVKPLTGDLYCGTGSLYIGESDNTSWTILKHSVQASQTMITLNLPTSTGTIALISDITNKSNKVFSSSAATLSALTIPSGAKANDLWFCTTTS